MTLLAGDGRLTVSALVTLSNSYPKGASRMGSLKPFLVNVSGHEVGYSMPLSRGANYNWVLGLSRPPVRLPP